MCVGASRLVLKSVSFLFGNFSLNCVNSHAEISFKPVLTLGHRCYLIKQQSSPSEIEAITIPAHIFNGRTMNRHAHPPPHHFPSNDDILGWLDSIPLSRLVHNLGADFADGLLAAEIVGHFFPEYVDFSLFQIARNMAQRVKNWRLLNSKVLPKIDLHIPGTVVHDIINENPRCIELFLVRLREKLEEHAFRTGRRSPWQWETWRSIHAERYHLPQIFLTSRQTAAPLPAYVALTRTGRTTDPDDNDPAELLKIKEDEIEILHAKLKRCEKVIHAQDKRIQDLEDKIVKIKLK